MTTNSGFDDLNKQCERSITKMSDAEALAHIDLLIEAPLPEDCEPEDMEDFDNVMEAIKTSDYLSFHDKFDMVAADAEKRLIYDRKSPT